MRKGGILLLLIAYISINILPKIDLSYAYTQLRFRPDYNFKISFKDEIRDVFIDGRFGAYVVTRNYKPDWNFFYSYALHGVNLLDNKLVGTFYFQTFDEILYDIIFDIHSLLFITQSGIFKISTGVTIFEDFFKIEVDNLLGYNKDKIFLHSNDNIVIVNRKSLEVVEKFEFKFEVDSNVILKDNIIYFISDNNLKMFDISNKIARDLLPIGKQTNRSYIKLQLQDNYIYFSVGTSFCSYDILNNSVKWKKEIPDLIEFNGFHVSDVVVLSKWGMKGSEIICINKIDGGLIWSYSKDTMLKNFSYLRYNDTSKIGFVCLNVLYFLDKKTGKLISKIKSGDYFGYVNSIDDIFLISYSNNGNNTLKKYVPPCSSITYKLNSKKVITDCGIYQIDQPPIMINNTAYISAKFLVEPLGGQLTYDQETKNIKINLIAPGSESQFNSSPENYEFRENTVELTNNSNISFVNGKSKQIDPKNPKITPVLINGRTMVPLRFLAESLECKINYDANKKEIEVTYKP